MDSVLTVAGIAVSVTANPLSWRCQCGASETLEPPRPSEIPEVTFELSLSHHAQTQHMGLEWLRRSELPDGTILLQYNEPPGLVGEIRSLLDAVGRPRAVFTYDTTLYDSEGGDLVITDKDAPRPSGS